MEGARFALVAIAFAACGNNNNNQHNGPDAPPMVDAAKPDAPLPGVAAIPLMSPDGTFYTAATTIGAQSFAMVVDTGSTTAAVAGTSCTTCAVTPKYTPGTSATDQHQAASAQYGSGSWNGEIFSDQMGLGAMTPAVAVKLASISSEKTFFDGNNNAFQGLLGLGGDGLLTQGTTSYFDGVVAAGVMNIVSFEMCDADGGTMWLGGYDPAHTAAAPQYASMSSQLPYYAVTLSDLKLGTTSVGFTSSTAIVDTGTSLFYVSQTVANNIVTQANKATTVFTGAFTSQQGVFCATTKTGVTAAQIDAALPPLALTFNGTGGAFTITAPATSSYLLDTGGGMYCIGISSNPQLAGFTLMGDIGMRGFVTIFDRVNHQVGFAPEKGCAGRPHAHASVATPLRERGHVPDLR
jgi:hypothetical protein